jgi:hypothetical protein
MSQKGHKRRLRPKHKILAAMSALVLGGGGVVLVSQGAFAGQDSRSAPVTATIDCPDVGDKLDNVPDQARKEVDANLAQLDTQVADAYKQLSSGQAKSKTLLGGLKQQRDKTNTDLSDTLGKAGQKPAGLQGLSGCVMKEAAAANPADEPALANGADGAAKQGAPQQQQQQQQAAKGGPARSDFVAIGNVKPNVRKPAARGGASTGSFAVQCGRNENNHFNPDNVIVAPGVSNGAHHMHDYVGNKTTDAFSTNNSLAQSGTTCTNGDQSAYYWPVLRLRDGKAEKDAQAPGGGQDANIGTILKPKQVTIEFKGSPVSKVTAMPRFMRIITGDAKALTNGNANANASWSSTGFENRQL